MSLSTRDGMTAQFMHFDDGVSTHPLVWIRCIGVRLSFHTRQRRLIEMRQKQHYYTVQTHWKHILNLDKADKHLQHHSEL